MLDRLYGALRGIFVPAEMRARIDAPPSVVAALEDDLNSPKAMAEVFQLARSLNKETNHDRRQELAAALLSAGELLGLMQNDAEEWFAGSDDGEMSVGDIEALIDKRNRARAESDFAAADSIRDQLAAAGVSIEDGPSGTRWRHSA